MKITLEKALLEAQPVTKKSSCNYDTLDDLFHIYVEGRGLKRSTINYLSAEPFTVKMACNSWDAIPYLIGILYRAQYDGYRPLELIGFTPEQVKKFQELCELLRQKAYQQTPEGGGQVKPNTLTNQLYDQVIANDF